MSSPFTRAMTEDEELMYDAGLMDGAEKMRKHILALLEPLLKCDECEAGDKVDDCSPGQVRHIVDLINLKAASLFPQEEVDEVRQVLSEMISGYAK